MYKLMAGLTIIVFYLMHSLLLGRANFTLLDFSLVIACALIGAGLDTMESKK